MSTRSILAVEITMGVAGLIMLVLMAIVAAI